MSIWGAFTNSVQAMNAQSRALHNISQNVANVSTAGYKRIDSRFATLLSNETGGTDIFSVNNADRLLVDRQGVLQQTGRWSDVALNGQGFFVVSDQSDGSGETLFTRKGSFQLEPAAEGTAGSYLVDTQGNYLQGWQVTADGQGGYTVDSGLSSVNIDYDAVLAGTATTQLRPQLNMDPSIGGTQRLTFNLYDSGANGTSVELAFARTATPNQWTMQMTPTGGTASAPITVTFDQSGQVATPPNATFNFAWADGTAGAIDLDTTELSQLAGGTQLADYTADGYPPGSLVGTYVGREGELVGSYSNGEDRVLYKLPVARFVEPKQLEERNGGGTYAATEEAGDYTLDELGVDWQGTAMMGDALEGSNVDVAEEFTRMMMTQRAYSSAAQVFKTADEMTSVARQMKS